MELEKLRNLADRQQWIEVLGKLARSYVVMEVPWLTRDAFDGEILFLLEDALRRGVVLWLAWGLHDNRKPAPAHAEVLNALTRLEALWTDQVTMKYRGNTHRKILLWDGRLAVIGSYNWGSFRGDPARGVRHEVSTVVSTPREIANLEDEFKALFGVDTLASPRDVQRSDA